ncbi:MAG: hypothetical protein ACRD20_20380 [Terriglobales bacterium]
MPARQAAPCLKCSQIVEASQVAFVADFRLRAVGMDENARSPQASVSICIPCADQMANGNEPPQHTRPLDNLVYQLLRDMLANDFTYQLHKWIALRKQVGLPLPQLAEPRLLKAVKELQRTMSLPANTQTIESDGGEGKGLVKVAS